MGGASSSLFPTRVLDCSTATPPSVGAAAGDAARYLYACSSDSTALTGQSLLHLLVLAVLATAGMLLYLVCARVGSRGAAARLAAQPGRRMPGGPPARPPAARRRALAALAACAADDAVPQPPRGNALDGALAYGTRGAGAPLWRYVVDIGADLLLTAREALARARPRGGGGRPPATLRAAVPALLEAYALDAIDLALIVFAVERAQVLGPLALGESEWVEFRERVWRVARTLSA
jgi:hypothetical protein